MGKKEKRSRESVKARSKRRKANKKNGKICQFCVCQMSIIQKSGKTVNFSIVHLNYFKTEHSHPTTVDTHNLIS